MAIDIISGFNVKEEGPIDIRTSVADQNARLALAWVFPSLLVYQQDEKTFYKYIGTPPSNVAGDWEQVVNFISGSGVPAASLGADDDLYIDTATGYVYKKAAGSWSTVSNMNGVEAFWGTDDPSVTDPGGLEGDIYFRSNGDFHQKTAGGWSGTPNFNIAGAAGANGDLYKTTTDTDLNFTDDPVTFTVDSGLAYTVGQSVIGVMQTNPAIKFEGFVQSYSGTTMILNTLTYTGSGTQTDTFDVNLNAIGVDGAQGKSGIPDERLDGSSGRKFDDAKITEVEAEGVAGDWTITAPWLAHVMVDQRDTTKNKAGINTDMDGHYVSYYYDNSTHYWFDVGIIKGDLGNPGLNGWNPVYSIYSDTVTTPGVTRYLLKLESWIGGGGPTPPTNYVGQYVGSAGFTTVLSQATNIRGPEGPAGQNLYPYSSLTNINTGSYKVPEARLQGIAAYDGSPINYGTKGYAYNQTWTRSDPIPTLGSVNYGEYLIFAQAEVVYMDPPSGSVSVSEPVPGPIEEEDVPPADTTTTTSTAFDSTKQASISLYLYASQDGNFNASVAGSKVLLKTHHTILKYNHIYPFTIISGLKTWTSTAHYVRLEGVCNTTGVKLWWSLNTAVQYTILQLNDGKLSLF